MSFASLGQVLDQITAKSQWRRGKRLGIILQSWQEIVGQEVARQTQPIGIYGGVLQVATSSAVWCQELSLQRSPILGKINQLLSRTHPQELLRDIRFSTARWQSPHPSSPPVLPTAVEPPPSALAAWQRLGQTLKQQRTVKCPRCQSYTTPFDLERWGVCRFCARQRFITPPR
jgi:predicted nucleic acid-binding Zn ribbon protein